jgi:hypothetical protein
MLSRDASTEALGAYAFPMFTRATSILSAIVAATILHSTAKADWLFDAESGGVWVGNAEVQIPGDTGSAFNFVDDLKPSDSQAYLRLRATWRLDDRQEISALYAPLSFDFDGSLDRDIDFAGGRFAAGQATSGSYRFNSYRLGYRYAFYKTERFTFGLGLTAKVRDAEIALRQGSYGRSDANLGLVPLINFHLNWRLAERFNFIFEGDALAAPQGRAEDVSAALQYQASERLALRLGYRVLEGGADNDEVNTFALFQYAMFGMTWRF